MRKRVRKYILMFISWYVLTVALFVAATVFAVLHFQSHTVVKTTCDQNNVCTTQTIQK